MGLTIDSRMIDGTYCQPVVDIVNRQPVSLSARAYISGNVMVDNSHSNAVYSPLINKRGCRSHRSFLFVENIIMENFQA